MSRMLGTENEWKTFYKETKVCVSSPEIPTNPAIFTHAESPVWDPEEQSLLFVDVSKQNVHRLDYTTGKIFTKHIGYGKVIVVSLESESHRLLVAVRSALYVLDWKVAGDNALRLITTFDHGLPDNVINEGKADAMGRFWAGTKGPHKGVDVHPDQAAFYSVDQYSITHPRLQLKPVSISNGITWSLNNTVMYYVDSPTQKVEAFDFDLHKGEISGRRMILDISSYGYKDAIPDGMTVDSRGNLWVALMFGGACRVTSVCLGGPNLDELFVTTSREHVDPKREPLAGAIFIIRGTGSQGVPHSAFRFDNADNY